MLNSSKDTDQTMSMVRKRDTPSAAKSNDDDDDILNSWE